MRRNDSIVGFLIDRAAQGACLHSVRGAAPAARQGAGPASRSGSVPPPPSPTHSSSSHPPLIHFSVRPSYCTSTCEAAAGGSNSPSHPHALQCRGSGAPHAARPPGRHRATPDRARAQPALAASPGRRPRPRTGTHLLQLGGAHQPGKAQHSDEGIELRITLVEREPAAEALGSLQGREWNACSMPTSPRVPPNQHSAATHTAPAVAAGPPARPPPSPAAPASCAPS